MQPFGQLVAVCDIDKDKADALAMQYGAMAYGSLDQLLAGHEGSTVAAICTPNGLHAVQSIACLRTGLHVICEKPMALTTSDCEAMIAAATASERKLFCVKQNRFNPPVTAVKKAIDEGRLGRIYSIQLSCFWNRDEKYYESPWRGTKELDGGTLFTQFSHFIDLLYWMVGDIKQAKAFVQNFAHKNMIEFEDSGVVIIEFENGAIGTINYTVNSFARNMEGSLTVLGEKGTVKIGGQYLNELSYQSIDHYSIGPLPAGNAPNDYGGYQGSMSNHDKIYENVFHVLNGKEGISIGAVDGLKTVKIIQQIYSSVNTVNG